MYRGCSWLPEPIELNGSVNDDEVVENLYQIFLHELLNERIIYRGMPVYFRTNDNKKIYGKEEAFFHIIAGYRGKPIVPERAKRLLWGKYILNNEPCPKYNLEKCCEGLWVWRTNHNQYKRDQVQIFHPKTNYLVILEDRKDHWVYITSFRIDNTYKRSELKLEYKRNKWP